MTLEDTEVNIVVTWQRARLENWTVRLDAGPSTIFRRPTDKKKVRERRGAELLPTLSPVTVEASHNLAYDRFNDEQGFGKPQTPDRGHPLATTSVVVLRNLEAKHTTNQ